MWHRIRLHSFFLQSISLRLQARHSPLADNEGKGERSGGAGGGPAAPLSLRPWLGLSAAAAAPPMAPGKAREGAAGGGPALPAGPPLPLRSPHCPSPVCSRPARQRTSPLAALSLAGGYGASGAGGIPSPGREMLQGLPAFPFLP